MVGGKWDTKAKSYEHDFEKFLIVIYSLRKNNIFIFHCSSGLNLKFIVSPATFYEHYYTYIYSHFWKHFYDSKTKRGIWFVLCRKFIFFPLKKRNIIIQGCPQVMRKDCAKCILSVFLYSLFQVIRNLQCYRKHKLTLKPSYLKNYRSSLQS